MEFWEILITNGIVVTISTLILTFWLDKRKDNYARQMDKRKDLYTQTHNLLAMFFSTVSEEESNKTRDKLLESYRDYQIWASDNVFLSFKKYLTVVIDKNSSQEERNIMYKNLVLEMRKDLLGRNTKVTIEDIEIHGVHKK